MPFRSRATVDEGDRKRPPVVERIPGLCPGAIVPAVAVMGPTVPLPPSVLCVDTFAELPGCLPSMVKTAPLRSCVAPVYALFAVSVTGADPPTFMKPPVPETKPEIVRVLVSEKRKLEPVPGRVIGPAHSLFPTFVNVAPTASVSGSRTVKAPLIETMPPAATVVPAAASPSAFAPLTPMVPRVTAVMPV